MTQRAIQQSFHTCGCAMPGMPVPCPAYGLAPYLARRAAKNGSCGLQEVFFTTFEHKNILTTRGVSYLDMAMLVHTSKISTFSQFLCLSGYLKRKFPSELFCKMCSIGFTLSILSLLNVISKKNWHQLHQINCLRKIACPVQLSWREYMWEVE